jgi:hypothetical protein
MAPKRKYLFQPTAKAIKAMSKGVPIATTAKKFNVHSIILYCKCSGRSPKQILSLGKKQRNKISSKISTIPSKNPNKQKRVLQLYSVHSVRRPIFSASTVALVSFHCTFRTYYCESLRSSAMATVTNCYPRKDVAYSGQASRSRRRHFAVK